MFCGDGNDSLMMMMASALFSLFCVGTIRHYICWFSAKSSDSACVSGM